MCCYGGMQPQVRINEAESRYELVSDTGERLGLADYHIDGDRITLPHTEIDPAHGGQGYGAVLVKGVLDDAERRGLRVHPVCPFVVRYLERHPEYQHLLG